MECSQPVCVELPLSSIRKKPKYHTLCQRGGLVCHSAQYGYLDSDDYCAFLKKIKRTVGDRRIALFFDGLNIQELNKIMEKFQAMFLINLHPKVKNHNYFLDQNILEFL